MDKIARIRQEIKQLRREVDDHNYYLDNSEQALGYSAALGDIEKFLNTLSEEPDKSLEEAVEEAATGLNLGSHLRFIEGFKAGAEWKEKQMLKDAVEGYVGKDGILTLSNGEAVDLSPSLDKIAFGLQPSQKVRIVVLKEEE